MNKLVSNIKKQPIIYVLFVALFLITVFKFSLIGKGFIAFPDEGRYTSSGKALQYFSELNFQTAFNVLFNEQSKPGDAVIKTVPNAFQFFTAKIFKLNYFESNNSFPLFIFNFIVFVLILYIHYKFSFLIFSDKFLALVSVVLYSSLTNSYLYLRHALPYDVSLLILYYVLYRILSKPEIFTHSKIKTILIGVLSFFGFLVYPGYFTLYLMIIFLFFFQNFKMTDLLLKLRQSVYFGLGSILCLLVFEGLSQLGGVSYLKQTLLYSGTITQGSFDESYTFILKYLYDVECISGILLIAGTLIFVVYAIADFKLNFERLKSFYLVAFAVFGIFLLYASAGYFLHSMILYGRLLHQYFPFICIFSLFALSRMLQLSKYRQLVLFGIAAVFVFNFFIQLEKYLVFVYPRDVAWNISKSMRLKDLPNYCEYSTNSNSIPVFEEKVIAEEDPQATYYNRNVFLVNGCYPYSLTDMRNFHVFIPTPSQQLLKSDPHFLNFKAYQYEGFSIEERNNLDEMKLQIKVYSN